MKIWFRGLLAALMSLCVLPVARADNLDAALVQQAGKVLQILKERNYHNVGVLKFRAQNGNQPLSFRVGPINTNLASRLENALVIKNDRARPLGIIHDATKVAEDHRLPSYSTDAGIEKLFKQRFPLAWEGPPVLPDAFLTGTIRAAADMKTAAVTIQAFEKKSTKLEQLVKFTIQIDRPLLNDLGQGFSLSSRALKQAKKSRALDLEAADDAVRRDQAPGGGTAPGGSLQGAEKLLDFQIRYDGQAQPYGPDPNNPGELRVAEPRQGQKVTFYMRNQAAERLGVTVMINGKNSLYEQELEPAECAMWLPAPGDEVEIKGFQIDQNTIKPFRVLSPAESEAMAYSDNLGIIGVYVFRSMKEKLADDRPDAVTPGGADADLTVTGARSLRNPSKGVKARSLAERQKQLGVLASGSKKSRGVIGGDSTVEKSAVSYLEFNNVEQQQALVIRYYRPKGR